MASKRNQYQFEDNTAETLVNLTSSSTPENTFYDARSYPVIDLTSEDLVDSTLLAYPFTAAIIADQGIPPSSISNKRCIEYDADPGPNPHHLSRKRRHLGYNALHHTQPRHDFDRDTRSSSAHYTSPPPPSSVPSTLVYPHGRVLQTRMATQPRENDISIEEVFMKDRLHLAVLSSFIWDPLWLSTKLNLRDIDTILCAGLKNACEREQTRRRWNQASAGRVSICFPPMETGTVCMHSKLMILSYGITLRIVIPTGNLHPQGWGTNDELDNTVFIIDLPRIEATASQSTHEFTAFRRELLFFLEKQNMPPNVRDEVLRFDFSATRNMAFVHSVGVPCFDDDLARSGFNSLALAVQHTGMRIADNAGLEIEYACSSLGTLSTGLVDLIYRAAKGSLFTGQTRKRGRILNPASLSHTRVYFPSEASVEKSAQGQSSAVLLDYKSFQNDHFQRQLLRDHVTPPEWGPLFRRTLSHSKLLLAHDVARTKAWAYVGSANLTESAWGKIVLDPKSKKNKFVCKNWEYGVLLPVSPAGIRSANAQDRGGFIGSPTALFKEWMEVPFVIPGPEHGERGPWIHNKRR